MNWKVVSVLVVASGLLGACGATQEKSATTVADQPKDPINLRSNGEEGDGTTPAKEGAVTQPPLEAQGVAVPDATKPKSPAPK